MIRCVLRNFLQVRLSSLEVCDRKINEDLSAELANPQPFHFSRSDSSMNPIIISQISDGKAYSLT
jgi:hypothetical protein